MWLGSGSFGPLARLLRPAESRDVVADPTSPEEAGKPKTKSAKRQADGAPRTHRPERLQAFMLPNVVIDGETLHEALRKLMAVYEETCKRTGEQPLQLTFAIPPGDTRKLRVNLGIRNLNTSIRLLGTLAGMKVSRNGLEYHFEPAAEKPQSIKRTIPLPANFGHLLQKMSGQSAGESLAVQLATLGMQVDASTSLTQSSQDEISIETGSTADFTTISALVKLLGDEPRLIQGFNARIIELPADAKIKATENQWLDRDGVDQLMRDVSQTPGASVWEVPSCGALNGSPATFDIFNGTPYPTESEEGDVERGQGNLLRLRGSTLGFGNQLNVDFTSEDRTMGVRPRAGDGIDERVILNDEHFHAENGTRVVVHTRTDGSKVLLVVGTTLTDASGKPVR
jgi:hypothetical protein